MRDRFRRIARVQKAHGRNGEVVAVPAHGLPPVVTEGLEVVVVPPVLRGTRWHRVERCQEDGRNGMLLALSGVVDLTASTELVGRHLLARVADLPADLALHDAARLVGRVVRDVTTADEGTIDEVMTGPANDVWVIRGDRGELLLPVIDEVVCDVPESGPIDVRVPAGLEWE